MTTIEFQTLPLQKWGLGNTDKPLIIAGPCSAESEEQVWKTAKQLKNIGVNIFRAGIWKPRTRPSIFEGIGREGLIWLSRVQRDLGMMTATEVATPAHLEQALKHKVDMLWIGARTTSNPFAVQAIADALRGVDIPVWVKNPVNPDIDLWLGALERLHKAGISKLGGILRGFCSYRKSSYRNQPRWQIAVELQQRISGLPMLCDPSHIGGKREFIEDISQKAINMNHDGLMIEAHSNPAKALTDNRQQLSPSALNQVVNSLVIRHAESTDDAFFKVLKELRAEIDELDEELLSTIQRRMTTSQAIGLHKNRADITILQPSRWRKILEKNLIEGEKRSLSGQFIREMFSAIHKESIDKQSAGLWAN